MESVTTDFNENGFSILPRPNPHTEPQGKF